MLFAVSVFIFWGCCVVFVALWFLLLCCFCCCIVFALRSRPTKATEKQQTDTWCTGCPSVAFLLLFSPSPGGGLDVFVSDPPLPDQLIFGQPLSHLLRLSFSYTLPCISSAIVSSAADVAPSTSFACTAPVRKLWKQKKNLSLYIYMCIYVYMYLYMLS